MTTHGPYNDYEQDETADLVRSLALSSAKLWEELFDRLRRLEQAQTELRELVARIQVGLPAGPEEASLEAGQSSRVALPEYSSPSGFEDAATEEADGGAGWDGEEAEPFPAPLAVEWHLHEPEPTDDLMPAPPIWSGAALDADEVPMPPLGFDLDTPPPPPVGFEFAAAPPPPPVGFELAAAPPSPPVGFDIAAIPPPPPPGFDIAGTPPPPPPGFDIADAPPPPPPGFDSTFAPTAPPAAPPWFDDEALASAPPPPPGFEVGAFPPPPPPPPSSAAGPETGPSTEQLFPAVDAGALLQAERPAPPASTGLLAARVSRGNSVEPPPPPHGYTIVRPAAPRSLEPEAEGGPARKDEETTKPPIITPDFFARAGRRRH